MHKDIAMPFGYPGCHSEMGDLEYLRNHGEQALQFPIKNNEEQQALSGIWLGMVTAKLDTIQIDTTERHILQGIILLEELGILAESSLVHRWHGQGRSG